MKNATSLVLLALTGCAHTEIFHGDASFSLEERKAFEKAAQTMSERVNAPRIEVVWDGAVHSPQNRIIHIQPTETSQPHANGKRYLADGVMRKEHGYWTCKIVPGVSLERFQQIAEHEIGHYYGIQHTPEDNSGVMHAFGGSVWTTADIIQCWKAGLCRP